LIPGFIRQAASRHLDARQPIIDDMQLTASWRGIYLVDYLFENLYSPQTVDNKVKRKAEHH